MTHLTRSLSQATGLSEVAVRRIMMAAPNRYKRYLIPKRSGGERLIAQPAKEVKFLQRAFVDVILSKMPIHPAATAYRDGQSIADNAKAHAGDGPILKVDLKEFFPSIRAQDWQQYCRDRSVFADEEDVHYSSLLLFQRPPRSRLLNLAIGAPSSPMLSNVIMFDFDVKIVENIESEHISYTRYADDLTFSAKRTGYLTGVLRAVARTVRQTKYPKLDINPRKTTYVTRKYHREVTGLTLTNDGKISLGRDRKRLISASVYRAKSGDLTEAEMQKLAGFLAFAKSAEPEFLAKLKVRYGSEIIQAIQKTVLMKHHKG